MFRRLQLLVLAVILVVAAFSTGFTFLFFLVYVGLLVGGGCYILTRLGLADLEAGYAVSQLSGHVGDRLRVTYTLRNTGRMPKPWLEIHNPTTLPGGLPGRALSAPRPRGALVARADRRSSVAATSGSSRSRSAPATRSGSSRRRRAVGQGITLVVYPRVDAAAAVEAAAGEHRGRARPARAHAPDDPARHDRPALRAGRLDEPHPLALDGPHGRDPGQGVRPRADGRRLDLPRPRRGRRGSAAATSRRPRSRSAPPRRRRQGAGREPRRRAHGQRPPDDGPARPTAAPASG